MRLVMPPDSLRERGLETAQTMPMDTSAGGERSASFDALIGLQKETVRPGQARLQLEPQQQLENLQGSVHGGVLMTLLDSAMARAAMSRSGQAESVVSVNLTVSFLKPAKGRLVAHGQAVGGGKSLCFCEGHVEDEHGGIVARGTGVFKCMARRA